MPKSIAMSLRHAQRALAIAAIVAFAASGARAQESAPAMPDSSYGESADNYQSSTGLPPPPADDQTNADTVTIPIPGGGEITADGPDAPSDTGLPTLHGSQWGETAMSPYSHDIGPIGY
jgi:hypothetical protein